MTNKQILSKVKEIIHNRLDRYHCGQIPGIKNDLLVEIDLLWLDVFSKSKKLNKGGSKNAL